MEDNQLTEYSFQDLIQKFKVTDRVILCIGDTVVDVTDYCSDHPGGPDILSEYHLADPDKTFEAFAEAGHSDKAKLLVDEFAIGKLISGTKNSIKQTDQKNTNPLIQGLEKYKYTSIFVTAFFLLGATLLTKLF